MRTLNCNRGSVHYFVIMHCDVVVLVFIIILILRNEKKG